MSNPLSVPTSHMIYTSDDFTSQLGEMYFERKVIWSGVLNSVTFFSKFRAFYLMYTTSESEWEIKNFR